MALPDSLAQQQDSMSVADEQWQAVYTDSTLRALIDRALGAFLILNDRKRTHPHFQLLFELLKRGLVILKLYSHVVFANY